jgi:hypothetical protein
MSRPTVPYDRRKKLPPHTITVLPIHYTLDSGATVQVGKITKGGEGYAIEMCNTQATGERTELKFRMTIEAAGALVDGITRHHNGDYGKGE